jgi:hypothetical protein
MQVNKHSRLAKLFAQTVHTAYAFVRVFQVNTDYGKVCRAIYQNADYRLFCYKRELYFGVATANRV